VRLPTPKQQVEIIEVKDQLTLEDDAGEVWLHRIDSPHVDGMLLGQVAKDNVVRVTDLHSPGRDTVKNARNSSVAEVVRRLGITGAAFAGGHGSNGKQSDLDAITAQQERLQAFGNLASGHSRVHFLSTSNPI
jgi:hypothetical protein